MTRRLQIHWLGALLLIGALVPVALPFLSHDFPFGHDTAAHLANAYRFNRAFLQGQVPVRWADGLTPGHGQPLFNFYQVGFYYLVELLHLTGLPLSVAFKAVPVLLWWLGALFTLLWLRPWGWVAAIGGSAMFALSPYLIVDGFVRAAYPELTAIVFALGALWACDAYLRGGKPGHWGLFALFAALMLISHLPAALIAVPAFAVEFLVVGLVSERAPRRVASLCAATALALGLAAFYVLPALAEMPLVQMHGLTEGGVDYHSQFVPASQWIRYLWTYKWNAFGTSLTDPLHLIPLQIGLLQWIALLAGILATAWQAARRRPLDAASLQMAAWCAVVGLAMFMMHRLSAVIWGSMPLLAFIQFPWRWFLLISIACAPIAAILTSRLPRPGLQAAVMLGILAVSIHLYDRRLTPFDYFHYADMNIDDPHWTEQLVPGKRQVEETSYDPAGARHDTAPGVLWTVAKGRATISETRATDAAVGATIAADVPSTIVLNIPAFPGWRVRVDGAEAPLAPNADGYPELALGAGSHAVEAAFTNTPVRTLANIVTLVSVGILGFAIRGFSGAPHGANNRDEKDRADEGDDD